MRRKTVRRAGRSLSSVGGSSQDGRGVEEAAPRVPILSVGDISRGGAVQKGPEAASCMLQGFRWFGTVFQQVAGEEGMVFHI